MELQYPWMLLTLLTVPLLYWLLRRRRPPAVVISTVMPVKPIACRRRKLSCLEYSVLAALLLLSLALARPRRAEPGKVIRSQGVDIVLALDISGSMAGIDRPASQSEGEFFRRVYSGKIDNRLQSAKNELKTFIKSRPNDRIGLIGFGNYAYSLVPPTLDHTLLLQRLQTLEPGEAGGATNISGAIALGVERLKKSDAPRRVLVLFTDGVETVPGALTPLEVAEIAKRSNIIIHTVGIGGVNGYQQMEIFGRRRWEPVRDSYDSQTLRRLAEIGNGIFFEAADSDNFNRVMQEINKLEKTDISAPRPVFYREYAIYPALVALTVLLLGFIGEQTFCLRLP